MAITNIFSAHGLSTTPVANSTGSNLLLSAVTAVYSWDATNAVDNKSNTWNQPTWYAHASAAFTIRFNYVNTGAIVGSGHTLTSIATAQWYSSFTFMGYAGVGAFDQETGLGSLNGTSFAATAGASITPSENNSLIVTMIGFSDNPGTVTPPAGFTLRTSTAGDGGWFTYVADKIQTTAAAESPVWTTTNAVNACTSTIVFKEAPVADTTAPVLSSPTGTQSGSVSANGTVVTDESNGTLYFWATTNATETGANIKANGGSQPITVTAGTKTVGFTGLSPSTTYYAHYIHRDAAGNDSNVVHSTSFTTTSFTSNISGDVTLLPFGVSGTISPVAASIVTQPFKNNSGVVQIGITIPKLIVIKLSDPTYVVASFTDLVTNGSGIPPISSGAIVAGTKYLVVTSNADATAFGCEPYIAV